MPALPGSINTRPDDVAVINGLLVPGVSEVEAVEYAGQLGSRSC